jgi:hypothetical protein
MGGRISQLFLLLALAALVACATAAAGGRAVAAGTITLIGPTGGSQVARTNLSPVFKWQVAGLDAGNANSIEMLQVSTDPSFRLGGAVQNFSCTNGVCPGQYQWNTSYWYLESDMCAYHPPQSTNCSKGVTVGGKFYWRVSIVSGPDKVFSPTWSFTVLPPKDKTAPFVGVEPGSAKRGSIAQFKFDAWDQTGPIREELDLYKNNRLVLRSRHGWGVLPPDVYFTVQLPANISPGNYTWCMTAFDQAGNKKKSCAAYVVTP